MSKQATKRCPHCANGFLFNNYGQDVECVNGVLIDIDVANEGWEMDVDYPPAPCQRNKRGEWKSGRNESQERLSEWADRGDGEATSAPPAPMI